MHDLTLSRSKRESIFLRFVMLDVSNRASIFFFHNIPHKNPQRKVNYSEDSGRWEGAWEYV